MRSHSIHFFATESDLGPVLEAAEGQLSIRYIKAGAAADNVPIEYESWRALPRFGESEHGNRLLDARYLLLPTSEPVAVRPIAQASGKARFAIDLKLNPHAILLSPGGLFKPGVLITGEISHLPGSKAAAALLRPYAKCIRHSFTRIGAFYVGPKAAQLLDSGHRLTSSASGPPEYDLHRE